MGFLTDYEERGLSFRGKFYEINPAYDIILNIQRMLKEESVLTDQDKLDAALGLLIPGGGPPEKMGFQEKAQLLEEIYRKFVDGKHRPRIGKQEKLVDFEEDGEYIYASFLQAYGIDLIERQGKLSFKKFLALFQGLPGETIIREIMRVRAKEIPAPNKYNQDEIRNLMELKAYYALASGRKGAGGPDALFTALERMMKKNERQVET